MHPGLSQIGYLAHAWEQQGSSKQICEIMKREHEEESPKRGLASNKELLPRMRLKLVT